MATIWPNTNTSRIFSTVMVTVDTVNMTSFRSDLQLMHLLAAIIFFEAQQPSGH